MTDTFEIKGLWVPIDITAKVVVAAGQVHVLDAFIHNSAGGIHIKYLGEVGYLKALEQIAAEARDRDRKGGGL